MVHSALGKEPVHVATLAAHETGARRRGPLEIEETGDASVQLCLPVPEESFVHTWHRSGLPLTLAVSGSSLP
jgi:hypothetical protein